MAVDYNELFADMGKLIKLSWEFHDNTTGNDYNAGDGNNPQPDIPAAQAGIFSQLTTSGKFGVTDGLDAQIDGFKDTIAGIIDSLSRRVQDLLLDENSVIIQLNSTISRNDINHLLTELARDMEVNNQFVLESTVSFSETNPITATDTSITGNNGNGALFWTPLLDGVSAPATGWIPQRCYAGIRSELTTTTEIMSVTCTGDENTSGLPEGQEVFAFEGKPGPVVAFDWRTEGSGANVSMNTLNSFDILSNRNFEIWSSGNLPVGWTLISGTPGVNIVQENTEADVFRGLYSLQLVGDGTDIDIRQTLGVGALQPQRMYMLGISVKGSATVDGALSIDFFSNAGDWQTATFTGTNMNWANANPDTITGTWGDGKDWIQNGFVAGMLVEVENANTPANNKTYKIASVTTTVLTLSPRNSVTADVADAVGTMVSISQIEMDTAALQAQTAWTSGTPLEVVAYEHFFFLAPETIPDDLQLRIRLTGATTGDVHLDSLAFGPVAYANGVGAAILAGRKQFAIDDRISVTALNDDAGLFQRYFRHKFKFLLPSSDVPTQANTLITAAY